MDKIPCSVGILTRNSAVTLRRALESVRDFDDIIVCDGGSTDDTLAIAESFGAMVIQQDPSFQKEDGTLKDYAGVRNQCLDTARHPWFLYIDSDECATAELVSDIRNIVTTNVPEHLIYQISPRIVLDGRVIEHSSNYPGWQKRFFNVTTGARFRKAVHERIQYDTHAYSVGSLQGHWHYFISSTEDGDKFERYARMDAALYQTRHLSRLVHLVRSKLITIVKIFLKAGFHYIWYGPANSMPLRLELRRIKYQWRLLVLLCAAYMGADITMPEVEHSTRA